ncbi:nitrate reductase subunit alpha [Pseudomonas aeruginosa]|uniref:nitrate reductase subunit alpha n=1 Tax=Pseudomonas aeruginosa TaxID=287 RepID=UPI000F88AEF6|nr:nitrate reductase subunit alpha [Pseudomonas aeruginosa]RPW39086.1 nitrate reductase subunit alpha [Pseudomonas aeruginosa]RUG75908.1 nitrate reductase subunit alpha [Pseudomonas aeruginosa]WCW73176.1 nitrate reductase subunit alpha [Pseudomonas aeruginosa]
MSHLLDRLQFFKKKQGEFADGHGETSNESRAWEGAYRQRWQHDKIVRSTHGVNCTGSCSWKIYVKNGLITWETQQTDYPRTRPDLPNHEPRGCPRGASYSWYIYSANRLKYPKVRKPLLKLWREARAQHGDPVNAWASIVEDAAKAKSYKSQRGLGGFVRSSWDEVTEIIAAANVYTAKTYGPDRVIGFSPIPAMSMVSYAAGARYLSLIGGVCLSFYDWYCDLPPASPQIWGEQTDVPESADWYNSSYIIAWGSNVPQTRTPDAHFFTEVRYKGTKTVSITPDYSEVAKLTDLWLNPKQGTDAALGMAFGHVILKEFHLDRPSAYFVDYCRQYTDMPMLVLLEEHAGGAFKPTRYLRAADLADNLGQDNNPEWKTIAYDERSGGLVSPTGAIGYRWGESGKWNIAELDGRSGDQTRLQLSLLDGPEHACEVAFPYFAGQEHPHFKGVANDEVLLRRVPFREIVAADGKRLRVATVYDLQMANYSIDRGLGGDNVATSYEDADTPYTPAWQERITGVPAARATQVAREFADSADKTRGKAMVIIGAAMNHWYHMDMNYRAVINMLMMCGCIGQSGGGWAHYVGQEKLRPQTGWAPLAFGLDWSRPPRQMNGTSFFYLHSSQWRHEKLSMHEVLSPLADASRFAEHALDYNIQAERLGWLPSAPQLNRNPLRIAAEAEAAGLPVADYVVRELKSGGLRFASESPDDPQNFPRNMFIWRSNLLGSSGKGHEYMLKYLLGAKNGVMNDDLGKAGGPRPTEVDWVDDGAEGKLDLVTTLDFRMSSTCMYSDIVLPTATWYEKDDLNTSDMHPFIHPLSAATDPAWEALSKITGREHAHLALPKEDEKIRFRDIQVQPRKIISSPTWSGLEDEHVSYNAGYTNVHELIPWRTITGRQQFYQDHPWMQAFGEGFVSYRPPVNTRTTEKLLNRKPNGNPEITLNWITPHQKWGIHSTYSDNLLMLTLSRGGPIIWLSEHDAAKAGIVDNDWVEVFNANGAATCRAVVSQRVKDGMVMMYHAQERIVNVPGSETTGTRGGHHNSVTRVVLKPTHMIGGYAQQAWGFNYYGTVGCNRDEFVVVRKMSKVDWLDEPRHGGLGGDALPQPLPQDI